MDTPSGQRGDHLNGVESEGLEFLIWVIGIYLYFGFLCLVFS